MATIEQNVGAIRTAAYGEQIREAIANGIENCYEDSTANALDFANKVVKVSTTQPNIELNRIWIKEGTPSYEVPLMSDLDKGPFLAYTNANELVANQDLNQVTEPGYYKIPTAVCPTLVHAPVNGKTGNGILIVERTNPYNNNYVKQTVYYGDGHQYFRFSNNNVFGVWNDVSSIGKDIDDLETAVGNGSFLTYANADYLDLGTNLNTVTTPGYYKISTNACPTLVNAPVNGKLGNGILVVERITPYNNNYIKQTFYYGTGYQYFRFFLNGTFGEWNDISSIGKDVDNLETAVGSLNSSTGSLRSDLNTEIASRTDSDLSFNKAFDAITGNAIIPITMTGNYLPMVGSNIDITTPTGSANFDYSLVPCSEGDIFTINALGGSSPRAWAFIKSDGTAISPYAPGNADVNNLVLTAPTNAAYLVINDKGKRQSYHGKVIKDRVVELEEAKTSHETIHPYSLETFLDTQREASSNWWINDITYHAGYVNHVKTYIWGDTDQDVQVALIRANNDSGYTSESKPKFNATGKYIVCKFTATGHGYVTIPINMYIPCNFWVSIKSPEGLAYYQLRGSQYHYKAGSALFNGMEGETANWEWMPADLSTTLSYIIAAEVEYASETDLKAKVYPVAKTINTMFCVGDSQTAGYPYQNVDSLSGIFWWNGVGRSLGYDVQQGSRSGSGWLYKSGSANAITITNSWADRIPGFNVAVYAYGTNDYGNNVPLGSIDDMWVSDSSGDQTYAGAINYVISRIYQLNPKIILVLATPFNRSDVGSASSNYGMGHQNADGHTLKDYCDMMVAICEKRGVMYVDRRTSALNTGTIGELLGDGLHPTAYGYKVLGAEMTAKLGALIHPYYDMV